MLQNAYFLAKIGADTAENEQHFAEILPKTGNYPTIHLRVISTGSTASPDLFQPLSILEGGGWSRFSCENALYAGKMYFRCENALSLRKRMFHLGNVFYTNEKQVTTCPCVDLYYA